MLTKVLLNQTDACIIDEHGYNISVDLNSQLKNKLKTIDSSATFPRGIICIRKTYESELLKYKIKEVLSNLHNEKDGKQILQLFNVSNLSEFKEESLSNFYVMMTKINKLKSNTAKTKTNKKSK